MNGRKEKRSNRWHALSAEEVSRILSVNPAAGLSEKEAAHRLRRFSTLPLWRPHRTSVLRTALDEFTDFAAILLIITVAVAALFERGTEATATAILLIVSGVMRITCEFLAARVFEKNAMASAPLATVLRAGKVHTVPESHIVPGDILLLETGDTVPCDARILTGEGEVVQSTLDGGDSLSLKNGAAVLSQDIPAAARTNMLFASSTVVSGSFRVLAVATGEHTYAYARRGPIFLGEKKETPLTERLNIWCRNVSLLMMGLVLLVCFGGAFLGDGTWEIDALFLSSLALAVASMSEFLTTVASVIFAVSLWQFRTTSGTHSAIKHLHTLESAVNADCVVFSSEEMLLSGDIRVDSWFYSTKLHESLPDGMCPPQLADMLHLTALCGGAGMALTLTSETRPDSPYISLAERLCARHHVSPDMASRRLIATSADGLQTALVEEGGQIIAYTLGELSDVLACVSSIERDGVSVPLPPLLREELLTHDASCRRQCIRTVAIARRLSPYNSLSRPNALRTKMTLLGFYTVVSPIEPTLLHLSEKCRAGNLPILLCASDIARARFLATEAGMFRDGEDRVIRNLQFLKAYLEEPSYNAILDLSEIRDREAVRRAWAESSACIVYVGKTVQDMPCFTDVSVSVAAADAVSRVPQCVMRRADVVLYPSQDESQVQSPAVGTLRMIGYAKNAMLRLRYAAEYLLLSQSLRLALMLASVCFRLPLQTPFLFLFWGLILDCTAVLSFAFPPPATSVLAKKKEHLCLPTWKSGTLLPFVSGFLAALASAAIPMLLPRFGIPFPEECMRPFLALEAILSASIATLLYVFPDGMRRVSLRLHAAYIVYVVLALATVLYWLLGKLLCSTIFSLTALPFALLPSLILVSLFVIYRKITSSGTK